MRPNKEWDYTVMVRLAVNTLSVTDSNAGTKTMMQCLLPALERVAPELEQVLICSRANRHLFDRGGEILEIPLGDGQKLRRIFCDQVTVPRLVKGRADVLFTPAGVPSLYAGLPQVVAVAAHLALPSCQKVAAAAGNDLFHRLYYSLPFRYSLSKADAVLGISQFLTDGLVDELGVDRGKATAMPLGVIMPSSEPGLDGREPMALFVGALYGYKDAVVAVRALAKARAKVPSARLVIAGRDYHHQMDVLRRVVSEAGVEDAVDLMGTVSSETLADLYDQASLLLMPSRCEGFGLPVAEAMSRGVPVVVANATSLPEVAGDAGIVVEPGDVDGFAEAIVAVLADPAHHRALAERGLTRARELSWEHSAECLRDAVRAVSPTTP
jgi:glycosyltransferase involved in cell wall biosynthesis